MNSNSKIYIAGHRGLVGSAIHKTLMDKGYINIIVRTHNELDLTNQDAVSKFFVKEKPEYVILAAAKVGGILANNNYRADFLYENLMIQNNVIHHSYLNKIKKLLFLGSTCIYPKNAPQPIKEEYLLTDTLEYTNEPYAIAKIAGMKMCESYNLQYGTNFISVMPTNLYGPNDNFDFEKSHVLPALIRKIHLAKLLSELKFKEILEDINFDSSDKARQFLSKIGVTEANVEIWGTGEPRREFLWSEDMAEACVFIMENRDFVDTYPKSQNEIINTHINIGTGIDISIRELAEMVKSVIGYEGNLIYNSNKPDGTQRKLTNVSKIKSLGWHHKIDIKEGIEKLYTWFLNK